LISSRASRDALVSLSLANLGLLEIWNALLNYTPAQSALFDREPSRSQYAAAFVNVFLVGFVFFLLIRLERWLNARYGSSGFLFGSVPILFVIALPAVRSIARIANGYLSLGARGTVGLFALLLLPAVIIVWRRSFSAAATLLVILTPLIPIEAALAISRCWTDQSAAFANRPLAPRVSQDSLPRVVWIIFDELDYRIPFPDRPSNLALPEFDRLRAESLFAENATSPDINTLQSVPSLLTGEKLSTVEPKSPSTVLLAGRPASAEPTIFSSVRGMGGNAAAAGWYIPYGRLFAQDLVACTWRALDGILNETRGTFLQSLLEQQQSLFEYGHYSILPESLMMRRRIQMLDTLHAAALEDVVDPSLNLVFLHFPVPHAPHFYDASTRTLTRRNAGAKSYSDSVALADVFLGDIRTAMTRVGLWDKTTVLVSSDHANRVAKLFDGKEDPRVPFLLKLAGQTSAVTYTAPLQTVVSKALLETILARQVNTPEEAVSWLQTHSPTSSSPSAQ
jgi:hypothetical protein